LKAQIETLKDGEIDSRILDVRRTLELCQKAYYLHLTRKPAEQADLVRNILLNCTIDAVSLYPTYRKPFDFIFNRARNEEWSGRADLNCRHLAPQAKLRIRYCFLSYSYGLAWGVFWGVFGWLRHIYVTNTSLIGSGRGRHLPP
jgi:hypothetical protein